jgi:FkbM family methyltransferase
VIEHGVDIHDFFAEAQRLVRPGGLLVLTTDYWEEKIEIPSEFRIFGLPWMIHSKEEIESLIQEASKYGFDPLDGESIPACGDPCVRWGGYEYTFILLAFRRTRECIEGADVSSSRPPSTKTQRKRKIRLSPIQSGWSFRLLQKAVKPFAGRGLGDTFPILRRAFRRTYWATRPQSTVVQGNRIMLNPNDAGSLSYDLIVHGEFEPFETELFVQSAHAGGVIIDIGANVGYYTVLAASASEVEAILAFEPDPTNFALLEQNVRANGYSTVEAFQVAVADEDKEIALYLSEDNSGDHRSYWIADREIVSIKAVRLDSFVQTSSAVASVIKMDIQGSEFNAAQGMKDLIDRSHHLALFSEFWPEGLSDAGTGADEYFSLLEAYGFSVFVILESSQSLKRASSVGDVLEELGPYGETNVLCVKGPWPQFVPYFR